MGSPWELSKRSGIIWQEGFKNPKELLQLFQSFLIWEMFQNLDNISLYMRCCSKSSCFFYWTGTEWVPLIHIQAHQYWIERMKPHPCTVWMPNWLTNSLLATRNPRFSFAKLCSSQLTLKCAYRWDYNSSVVGFCNTHFWSSRDFCQPISPVCWGSSGWQHSSLEN